MLINFSFNCDLSWGTEESLFSKMREFLSLPTIHIKQDGIRLQIAKLSLLFGRPAQRSSESDTSLGIAQFTLRRHHMKSHCSLWSLYFEAVAICCLEMFCLVDSFGHILLVTCLLSHPILWTTLLVYISIGSDKTCSFGCHLPG